MSRRLDEPLLTWDECCVLGDGDQPCGVVIALPHDADRLDVGLAIRGTEWGAQCMPDPDPGEMTVREAWARLLTLREQWEWEAERRKERDAQVADEAPAGNPPADWWPQESTPSWVEDPAGEQVWIVTWTS